MLKKILGVGLLSSSVLSCYMYYNNNSFRSVCNLAYAGTHIAYIYKFTDQPIHIKNIKASQYLRDALKKNGGIYLKLGQLIASLDVIVPDQYRFVMSTLCRQCKKSSYQDIKKTIEQQIGFPIDVIFQTFEKEPIASASMAQVHRAILLNGEYVAVKVQHKNLLENIESDLSLLRWCNDMAKKIFQQFHYEWLVEGFQKNIRRQLNFQLQAQNMQKVSMFLEQNNFKQIYVPKVYLKPTKKVLVMEFIQGIHIDQVDKIKKAKINSKFMAKSFSKMITKMIHKQGFVHADPHAGNLMVRKYQNKDQLVILDHGLYQVMDKELVRNYNEFWLGLILNDPSFYEKGGRMLGTSNPKMLCQMLTSKSLDELQSKSRKLFDLNPSGNRDQIMKEAAKNHEKIVKVLQQLRRQILLLLKVNEFARTIQNLLGGRQMGVYQDIAIQCLNNLDFPFYKRWFYYWKMYMSKF